MNTFFIVALIVTVLVSALIVIYYRQQSKKMMQYLSRILDDAIAGKFDETKYDESRLSQVEDKLGRFLNSSKLSRNNIEKEQDRIKSLISDISHQTKTPIANILLYTELLLEQDDLPAKVKELAEQIRPQTEKLNFLIQSLIKTSRLESGIVTVLPMPNKVSELIERTILDCTPNAKVKNITLLLENNTIEILALFDPKWTGEALYNVIDNAVKYTAPKGQIIIKFLAYEMFIRIDVTDNGMGIPENEQPKIFERFWRSTSVASVEGVGIGLFLAREIIVAQGGYMKVKSKLGQGSTFTIYLPKV